MPSTAWSPAVTCATASQIQYRSPGPRLAIHAPRPQTQPTAKIPTTANPTTSWTSGTSRSLRGRVTFRGSARYAPAPS